MLKDVFFDLNIFLTPGFIGPEIFPSPRCRTAQPFGLGGVQGWKGDDFWVGCGCCPGFCAGNIGIKTDFSG